MIFCRQTKFLIPPNSVAVNLPTKIEGDNKLDNKTYILEAIENAKTKLKLYREKSSGEYIGGQEYTQLIEMLNNAQIKVGQIEPQVSLAASSSGAKSEPTFGKWIECKMELPESGDTVLCCNTMGEVHEAEFWRKGKTTKWNFTAPYYGQDLEHEFRLIYKWMPLPKP